MKTSAVAIARQRVEKPSTTAIPISLGGLAFGNHYGPMDQLRALDVINEALDRGVTSFDASPTYGQGAGEELLARALGSRTDEVSISTRLAAPSDTLHAVRRKNDSESILRCLEGSLRRLHRNRVDLYFIEGPDPSTPLGATMEAMEQLREVGLIKEIGLFASTMALLRKALRYGRIGAVMVPYNILNRPFDPEFFTACREAGVAVHAVEPFCRGLLTGHLHKNSVFEEGDLRTNDPRFRGETYRHNIDLTAQLSAFAAAEGLTLLELSLGWILQHPSIKLAVCGARTTEQVDEIIAASTKRLTLEQILEVDFIIGNDKYQHS